MASTEEVSLEEDSDTQADSPTQSDASEINGKSVQSFVIDFGTESESTNKDHSLQDAFLLYKKKRQVLR